MRIERRGKTFTRGGREEDLREPGSVVPFAFADATVEVEPGRMQGEGEGRMQGEGEGRAWGEGALPVIDLGLVRAGRRSEVAGRLLAALEHSGFFYVTGIPGYDSNALLRHTKWFFALPLEEKMKVAKRQFRRDSGCLYKGYFPVQPGEISHKEVHQLKAVTVSG
ncbi:unnamed protein product [Darwinula stevensoni]|uniref:Non-haem dioxygenase N-terminal domain-containing protein n=1 Tax=Darwinula stevensoni TaxID=69355 RepID=A0A7R9A0C4_9CRUS|nr:unnamed protein product [Darwinula stevensoni]CAG0884326.1 unnamed protein product [Darwinula stevensoni]